ncbi:Ankyrin repeat [Verrucomicrobium sp. GAS474]|uniref:ankyrin repeat domain-containing protein n=1 Tax=Verrucomicrobium sp. GAS474 TaxID=1882831 RepID=UPI000879EE9D|nr:ankyrin repeat domain-containing protein [Verrucomicrobium sp. GAS474]SDU08724.1 Ankyrin repeat [Verrucomicrobium sp. GAS474]
MVTTFFSPTASLELDERLARALRENHVENLHLAARHLPGLPSNYRFGGNDLLSLAILHHAHHCIAPLHEMGFSMDRLSPKDDKHPLEEAMDAQSPRVLEALLEHGADPNAPHTLHGTIMRAAAMTRTIDSLIPLLCSRGGDPNVPSPDNGSKPLHAAVSQNETLNVEQLLALGADVNALDLYGRTPIQIALTRLEECDRMVTLLLDRGANPLIPDCGGLNALDLAKVREDSGLLTLLRQRVDWETLLTPPAATAVPGDGAPRPGDIFRRALLSAVDTGDQRMFREIFQIEGRAWRPVKTLEESPLLAALAKQRLDLAAPLIARGLGIEDTDAEGHNAIYYLLLATDEVPILRSFLRALHRLEPGLITAREQNGIPQIAAALHRRGIADPTAIQALLDDLRRPRPTATPAPTDAERRRPASLIRPSFQVAMA